MLQPEIITLKCTFEVGEVKSQYPQYLATAHHIGASLSGEEGKEVRSQRWKSADLRRHTFATNGCPLKFTVSK